MNFTYCFSLVMKMKVLVIKLLTRYDTVRTFQIFYTSIKIYTSVNSDPNKNGCKMKTIKSELHANAVIVCLNSVVVHQ